MSNTAQMARKHAAAYAATCQEAEARRVAAEVAASEVVRRVQLAAVAAAAKEAADVAAPTDAALAAFADAAFAEVPDHELAAAATDGIAAAYPVSEVHAESDSLRSPDRTTPPHMRIAQYGVSDLTSQPTSYYLPHSEQHFTYFPRGELEDSDDDLIHV